MMRMLIEGGVVVYLLIAAGLVHGLLVLVQLGLCKKVDFSGYLWAGYAGIVALGASGCMLSLGKCLAAVSNSSPEMVAALMAAGVAGALACALVTVILCIPGLFFTGIAASLARNLAPVRIKES